MESAWGASATTTPLYWRDYPRFATVSILSVEAFAITHSNVTSSNWTHAAAFSFLRYESFDTPFPALLTALSCDLERGSARHIDFTTRRNPPILHRKELLLPEDDPRVAEATRLTDRLERLGAFSNRATIGTRDGWRRQLLALGLEDPENLPP